MASIFKQAYTKKDPATGERVKKFSKRWYIEFRDAAGLVRRVPGYSDKRATEQRAAELERASARGDVGMVDTRAPHRRRLLKDHVADYRVTLETKDDDPKHLRQTERAILRIFESAGVMVPGDVTKDRLEAALARLRVEGKSHRTYNYYLTAVRGFFRWMVRQDRLENNPLDHLRRVNEETDRRRERRAIAAKDLDRLIQVAADGETFRGLAGFDRAMLYRLAALSGLRCSELASLTPASFDLSRTPPVVSVVARISKRRKEDVLPLRSDLAGLLNVWLSGKDEGERVFPGTWHLRAADMLKKDLMKCGIPYSDEQGRVFDFHSTRVQFVTSLARAGVHPKTAQQLARHSDINLTMGAYTKVDLQELGEAVERLSPMAEPDETGATGKRR
jgi:site-specific recombinase XerC